jgi:hypothetical protein
MARTISARSRKPKLPKFSPVFTEEQVFQIEANYNESWAVKRRLMMIALARTPAQLVEEFARIDGESFSELLGHFEDFKNHCKTAIELAEIASARMLDVGMYIIADTTEGATA